MQEEKTIWQGTPSQWVNFMFYICCIPLSLVFGLGILFAFWKYLDTKYNQLTITDQRIIEERGILSKTTKELEVYRIKDITLTEPFLLRIFGLSNIVLITADMDTPKQVLMGLETGYIIKEKLRVAVDIRRDLKGVRELDLA
ncbi:PH domain-containing protein [Aquimarina sp. W85]|uniref:PH domain-containing protein n=1 Tax=Aquimarina rhodophyticola TaxID=3342246 RepID=UPI00366A6841